MDKKYKYKELKILKIFKFLKKKNLRSNRSLHTSQPMTKKDTIAQKIASETIYYFFPFLFREKPYIPNAFLSENFLFLVLPWENS